MTASLRDLKVYTTYPHNCSYLDEQEAVTLFVDPQHDIDKVLYSRLSNIGFRRSGSHIYRPHCERCNACIPARIPLRTFKPSRSQKRALSRNRNLVVEKTPSINDESAYDLYRRYIEQRHHDGDMYPPERDQYESFLNNPWDCTQYYRFYKTDSSDCPTLIAVVVADILQDGQSAIYTFFDPEENKRSLGTYTILWQIENALSLGLDYLYLGYWIRNCQKMAYKSSFGPLELCINNQWTAV